MESPMANELRPVAEPPGNHPIGPRHSEDNATGQEAGATKSPDNLKWIRRGRPDHIQPSPTPQRQNNSEKKPSPACVTPIRHQPPADAESHASRSVLVLRTPLPIAGAHTQETLSYPPPAVAGGGQKLTRASPPRHPGREGCPERRRKTRWSPVQSASAVR